MSLTKMAIIGAGMAGITAANTLAATDYPVQVSEKFCGSGACLTSKRWQ